MIATAPGKLILSGEYAVLDGAPALVVAVDRRVVARRGAGGSSPFLAAVAAELAARRGADDPAAQRARDICVDSAPFYAGAQKLGLGSSAAVTVAAAALALGEVTSDLYEIATAAHSAAQGTRGSGADIAAAIHGGALVFTRGHVAPFAWPAVALVPFYTGQSADTATLVAAVNAARGGAVDRALERIARASEAVCGASDLIAALRAAGDATDSLAAATGLPLVPACVTRARAAMAAFGGTAKTTGAGGGDVGVAVVPAACDLAAVRAALVEAGGQPLALAVDGRGVDLRADPA